jgi:hypothetical protein
MLFFLPNYLGHPDNYIPANPLSTPAHITPEWYFWPFYAILRAFTVDFILEAKLWGVIAMFAAILVLFILPWLDTSPVRLGQLPADVPDVLLHLARRGVCARMVRRRRGRRALSDDQPDRDGLLFRLLPDHRARAVEDREDAALAQFHLFGGAGRELRGSPIGMETGTPADQARGGHRPGDGRGGLSPQPAE